MKPSGSYISRPRFASKRYREIIPTGLAVTVTIHLCDMLSSPSAKSAKWEYSKGEKIVKQREKQIRLWTKSGHKPKTIAALLIGSNTELTQLVLALGKGYLIGVDDKTPTPIGDTSRFGDRIVGKDVSGLNPKIGERQ